MSQFTPSGKPKSWQKYSYAGTDNPALRRMEYEDLQVIHDLYVRRASFTMTRSGPMRWKMPAEEKQRFMSNMFGAKVGKAEGEGVGKTMFDVLSQEYIDAFVVARRRFNEQVEEFPRIKDTLEPHGWTQDMVTEIAKKYGAEIVGYCTYDDPYYRRPMASMVFGMNMREINDVPVPSLEADAIAFNLNTTLQEATTNITYALWEKKIFCEPVACATYYSLDNLEWNQTRFCEAALDGCIGKCFYFISTELGAQFRMSQILLEIPPGMEFKPPKQVDLCKECDICVKSCPSGALRIDDAIVCGKYFFANDRCSVCARVCPVGQQK